MECQTESQVRKTESKLRFRFFSRFVSIFFLSQTSTQGCGNTGEPADESVRPDEIATHSLDP